MIVKSKKGCLPQPASVGLLLLVLFLLVIPARGWSQSALLNRKQLPHALFVLKEFELKGNQYFSGEEENEGQQLIKNQELTLPYVKVPLSLVKVYLDQVSPITHRSLVERDEKGELFLRWFINPDDTLHTPQLLQFLQKHQLDTTFYQHTTAYRTSSRSFFVQDPQVNQWAYNVKMSTNNTAGLFKQKHLGREFVEQEHRVRKYVMKAMAKQRPENLKLLPESALYLIEDIDQGMAVREMLNPMLKEKERPLMLPGFTVVHEHYGAVIAQINDKKSSTADFWKEHFVIPYAGALAEFFAATAMIPSSLHSQNFYVELSQDFAPTGKIILKDFGDVYFQQERLHSLKMKNQLKKLNNEELVTSFFDSEFQDLIHLPFAIFQTMERKLPSWLSPEKLQDWKKMFYQSFEMTFAKKAGIRLRPHMNRSNQGSMGYWNWALFQHDLYKQCFAVKSDLSDEECNELLRCVQVTCEQQNMFSADVTDVMEEGMERYLKNQQNYRTCLKAAEGTCADQLQGQRMGCLKLPTPEVKFLQHARF